MSGLSLGEIGNLSSLLKAEGSEKEGFLLIPIGDVAEDPSQPRKSDNEGFSDDSINELAMSISARGLLSPISVREDENKANKYIVNHGARRLRAAKKAGLKEIPAIINNNYKFIDQIIENLQREGLNLSEMVDSIQFLKSEGMTLKAIAQEIGKSQAYVTQLNKLSNLPKEIDEAVKAGRITDITLISEIESVYKKDKENVIQWLETEETPTRKEFLIFKDYLKNGSAEENDTAAEIPNDDTRENIATVDSDNIDELDELEAPTTKEATKKKEGTSKKKKESLEEATIGNISDILVAFKGENYILSLTELPSQRNDEGKLSAQKAIIYKPNGYENRLIVDVADLTIKEIIFK